MDVQINFRRRFAVEDETPESPKSATKQGRRCNYGLDRRSEVFERLVMHAAGVYQLFVPLTSDSLAVHRSFADFSFLDCFDRRYVSSSRFVERRVSPLIDQSTKHPFIIHLAKHDRFKPMRPSASPSLIDAHKNGRDDEPAYLIITNVFIVPLKRYRPVDQVRIRNDFASLPVQRREILQQPMPTVRRPAERSRTAGSWASHGLRR